MNNSKYNTNSTINIFIAGVNYLYEFEFKKDGVHLPSIEIGLGDFPAWDGKFVLPEYRWCDTAEAALRRAGRTAIMKDRKVQRLLDSARDRENRYASSGALQPEVRKEKAAKKRYAAYASWVKAQETQAENLREKQRAESNLRKTAVEKAAAGRFAKAAERDLKKISLAAAAAAKLKVDKTFVDTNGINIRLAVYAAGLSADVVESAEIRKAKADADYNAAVAAKKAAAEKAAAYGEELRKLRLKVERADRDLLALEANNKVTEPIRHHNKALKDAFVAAGITSVVVVAKGGNK